MPKIILLTGASGAGKDTLLKKARVYFRNHPKIHFIKRVITRKPGEFEENYYIEDSAFELLKESGFFISWWNAHGLKYGIPRREVDHLKRGETAIVSISREKVSDFETRFKDQVVVINVTASREVIEKRLKERKRENQLQIITRLKRRDIPVTAKHLINFDNNREIDISSKAFIKLLKKIILEMA
jgi:phosphonate metabolism protein PhnN/1,5-bisphosphokinase (PRPP-forming)